MQSKLFNTGYTFTVVSHACGCYLILHNAGKREHWTYRICT